jgi:hypothetical protein
MPTKRFSK